MIAFVDFDDVLFNTRDFMRDLVAACESLGVSAALWHATYKRRAGDIPDVHAPFTIARFSTLLAAASGVPAAALRRAMEERAMHDLTRYVFPDSAAFLARARARGGAHILTYGDTDFQRVRVEESGLARLVDGVFVTQSQKVEVLADFLAAHPSQAPRDITYLDDRTTYFGPVKAQFPAIRTVLVARPERRYADAPTAACDAVTPDLASYAL